MQENQIIKQGKNTAIISYMTIVGAIIAIMMNRETKNTFACFHIRQAFGIHLLFHAFAILSNLWGGAYGFYGLYLCYIIIWMYGFIGALSSKKQEIPYLGPFFQKWFTFIE